MSFIFEYFPLNGKYSVSMEGLKYNERQQYGPGGNALTVKFDDLRLIPELSLVVGETLHTSYLLNYSSML